MLPHILTEFVIDFQIIRHEDGLGLHLDRNPSDPYLLNNGGLKKWRPIQSFISLTDQYGSGGGGIKVVSGFHKQLDESFINYHQEGGGEFCRLNNKIHCKLHKKLEPLNVPKGSIVFFDNRLPHATCDNLSGNDTREVIYFSYIPCVKQNAKYLLSQTEHFIKELIPPMYSSNSAGDISLRYFEINALNSLQKKLLKII